MTTSAPTTPHRRRVRAVTAVTRIRSRRRPISPNRAAATLVIGIGNPDRGDDSAGLLAARRVRELCVRRCRVVECTGSLTSLLDLWTSADRVILIDAMLGEHPGRWRRLDASAAEILAAPASSHGFGVGEVIGLARALGALPRSLTVYAIEGDTFVPGSPASEAVAAAAREVAARIAA